MNDERRTMKDDLFIVHTSSFIVWSLGRPRMKNKTFAMCLLALAGVAGNAFAIGEARLTGKITDAVTKAPIPNATITLVSTGGRNFKGDYKSEKDGMYRILVLDGTLPYQVTFAAPGYQPYVETMKLRLGELNTKDVALTPANAAAPAAGTLPPTKADPAVTAYNDGAVLYNDGKKTEAAAKFEEAVAAKPDLIAGWEALAKVSVELKKNDRAIQAANKALELAPDETDMYAVLYNAYLATGDKARAAEAKKKLPADANSLFNDAAKAINSGKDAEAEPLLKQAIAVNDKFAVAYYELGMLYVRTGKNADAKANLQKYIELDPTGKEAATAKEMLKYVK
jgi:tetratricopeptide (TPR) repeat protein